MRELPGGEAFRRYANGIESARAQLAAVEGYFARLTAAPQTTEALAA
jgi:hypothetical protein